MIFRVNLDSHVNAIIISFNVFLFDLIMSIVNVAILPYIEAYVMPGVVP